MSVCSQLIEPCRICKCRGWYIEAPDVYNNFENNLVVVCPICNGSGYIKLEEKNEKRQNNYTIPG